MNGRKKAPRLKTISHLLPWLIFTLISTIRVFVKFWQQFFKIFLFSPLKQRRFWGTAIAAFWITLFLSSMHLVMPPSAMASANLSIEPLTWDIIGLDSNNPNVGPDKYLIGARVCNLSSTETAQNVTIRFVREGAYNPLISINTTGLYKDKWIVPSLPPSATGNAPINHHQQKTRPANCFDAYFVATMTRTSNIYNKIQQYRIEAYADNAGFVDTNSYSDPYQGTINEYDTGHPRQLYIEKILSQSRNAVLSFAPITLPGIDTATGSGGNYQVEVGGTYAFELTSKTSTAYPQLTISSDFPNAVFQIIDVQTDYENVGGIGSADNSSIYANACGWISDPTVAGYHESSSNCEYETIAPGQGTPDQYPAEAGKVGNLVKTRYIFKILSGSGTYNINHLILDFSGGSYHYNSDYGSGLGIATFEVVQKNADLTIDKSHTGNFTPGNNLYTFTVTNNGLDTARKNLVITDTLPNGFTFNPSATAVNGVESQSGNITGWSCTGTQSITCTNPNDLAFNQSTTLTIRVNVNSSAAINTFNKATVTSSTNDPNLNNNTDTDPTTIIQAANLKLTKADSNPDATANPSSNNLPTIVAGGQITYNFTVENLSTVTANAPITITDTLPSGLTFSLADNPSYNPLNNPTQWSCSIEGQNLSCTYVGGNGSLAGNTSTPPLSLVFTTNSAPITTGTSAVVTNTATVSSSSIESNNSDNTSSDDFTISLPVSDLTIKKTDYDASFVVNTQGQGSGENLVYNITVQNKGTVATRGNIQIREQLPTGVTYISHTGLDTNGNSLTWNCTQGINPTTTNACVSNSTTGNVTFTYTGSLAPGEIAQLNLTVKGPSTTTPSSLNNIVTVFNANDGTTQPKTATEITPVITGGSRYNIGVRKRLTQINGVAPSPVCTITPDATSYGTTEVCTNTITPGDNIQYTVIVVNNNNAGPDAVTFQLSDFIPNEVTLNLNSISCTATGSQGQNVADCDTGTTGTQATATVIASLIDGTVDPPKYRINQPALVPKNAGVITYVFTGSIKTVSQLQALSKVDTTITNRVTVPLTDGVNADQNPLDNIATTRFQLSATDLQITKTDDPTGVNDPGSTSFVAGAEGSYILRVSTVDSRSTIGSIKVVDDLPDEFEFLYATGAGWLCSIANPTDPNSATNPTTDGINNNILTCTRSTAIAGNSSSDIQIVVKPIGTWITSGQIFTNLAQVQTPGDTNTANNGNAPGTASPNTTFGYEQTPVIAPDFDLKITKSAVGNFAVGQTASYKLDILNNGPTTAIASISNPITVTDTLPSELSFVSATGGGWSCSATGQLVTCTRNSNLASGATTSITLNVVVNNTPSNQITNAAQVSLTGENASKIITNDNNSQSRNRHEITTSIQRSADLSITKVLTSLITNPTPPPATIPGLVAGETATYQIAVTNNGPSNILSGETITVSDALPSTLSFVSGSGNGFTCSTGVICTKTNGLAVGETATITLTVNVNAGATGTITNTANVTTATTPDPNTTNNQATTSNLVQTRNLDLAITKTHLASSFPIGGQGTYSLEVKNVGNVKATDTITITDNLPANLQFVEAIGLNWTCSGTTSITCTTNDDLEVGATNTVNVIVTVGAGTPMGTNSITNQATVSITGDNNGNNNSDIDPTTITGSVDLSVTKTPIGNFTLNSVEAYKLVVKNNASSVSNATGIKLVDQLPDGIYYISGSGTNWICPSVTFTAPGPSSPDLRDIECTYTPNLAPGATANELTINVYVQATAPSSFINSATVISQEADSNTDNNTSTVLTTIGSTGSSPNLILLKRITNITPNLTGTNFSTFVEDGTPNNEDNDSAWPDRNIYLQGQLNVNNVLPEDEVEYTIYFLNKGTSDALNVSLCDVIPNNMSYISDSIKLFFDTSSPLENPPTTLTNLTDILGDDRGSFYSPFSQPPALCKNPNNPSQSLSSADNKTGAVVVNIVSGNETLPKANSPGNPSNSYGFVRFRVKVD